MVARAQSSATLLERTGASLGIEPLDIFGLRFIIITLSYKSWQCGTGRKCRRYGPSAERQELSSVLS